MLLALALLYMISCLSTISPQDGGTALYAASQRGYTNIVDILLKYGASPNLALTVSKSKKLDAMSSWAVG